MFWSIDLHNTINCLMKLADCPFFWWIKSVQSSSFYILILWLIWFKLKLF